MQYTIMVFSFATGTAFFVFMRCMIIFTMNLRGAKLVHNEMIKTVIGAPINLFYDVTPTGTVMNRFSKDL